MPVDLAAARRLVVDRLPASARWPVMGSFVQWTFGGPWGPVDPEVFAIDDATVAALAPYVVFGEYVHDGACMPLVALHERDGTVHGIDVELESDPVFWFNSSLEAFVETFSLLDSALWSGRVPSPELRRQAELLDPAGFEDSDWAGLLAAIHALGG